MSVVPHFLGSTAGIDMEFSTVSSVGVLKRFLGQLPSFALDPNNFVKMMDGSVVGVGEP